VSRLLNRFRAHRKARASWKAFDRMVKDPQLSEAFLHYLDACEEELGRPGTVSDLVPWLRAQPATFESLALLSALGEA
jgi:hypothetical protein